MIQMLQGAAAAIAEMHAGRRYAIRAIDEAGEDTADPPAVAFAFQPDKQAIARGATGNEDRLAGGMADTVAPMPERGYINFDLPRLDRHILLLSRAMAPLS
jgi:hypothetical protein